MRIQNTQTKNNSIYFNGNMNWLLKFDKAIGKLIEPKPVLTPKSKELVNSVVTLASKKYNNISPETVKLSVKNGNKEFSFLYNNSAWHRVHLSKKGEVVCDFEILHIKGDERYDFYSTGSYPCCVNDQKYIDKFNGILEEWMPRLVNRYEKLETKTKSL